jgi:cytochrome c biogenesis protein CcmG/thiol:disulfide interchange protein DsbE
MNTADTPNTTASTPESPSGSGARRTAFLLPLALFGVLVLVLGVGLFLNPREIPSPLIGRPVPTFDLPPVQGRTLGLSSRDLQSEVSLVNVFASWCVACREEHPVLMELARSGAVPIHGLNYKDKPDDAARWLKDWGDPYTRTGADLDGRVAIDWGVYGVPETFVIGRDGRIAYKHIGPITREFARDQLLPMIEQLRQAP